MYAIIHSTYEVASISNLAGIAVHNDNDNDAGDNIKTQLHILSWALGLMSQRIQL